MSPDPGPEPDPATDPDGGPGPRPETGPAIEPATEPTDVALTAALDAHASGVDLAEWFVHLVAATAVAAELDDPAAAPLFRRTGSWEYALVAQIIQSSGAQVHPDMYRREPRPLLSDLSMDDIARWLSGGLRERYGDELADRAGALADDIAAAHMARLRDGTW